MRKFRICVMCFLTAVVCGLSAMAVDANGWLVPKQREAAVFADVTDTWCENYVDTVYQAGLMSGKTAENFDAVSPLTHAQITVITARLHDLLRGGNGVLPSPAAGEAWYQPAVDYLQANCADENVGYTLKNLKQNADEPCSRLTFVHMLSGVLPEVLPAINDVNVVIDTADEDVAAFYRAGILNGSDAYGTFRENASLTRGAAAAMLARLADPAQRLEFTLKDFDLCRDILGVAPETVLLTVNGEDVSAALLAPQLCDAIRQRNGGTAALTDAVQFWCAYSGSVRALADTQGVRPSSAELADIAAEAAQKDGLYGRTAAYWQFSGEKISLNGMLRDRYIAQNEKTGEAEYHKALEACAQTLAEQTVITDALQNIDLIAANQRLQSVTIPLGI